MIDTPTMLSKNYKFVLVVRSALGMTAGEIAAEALKLGLSAEFEDYLDANDHATALWHKNGRPVELYASPGGDSGVDWFYQMSEDADQLAVPTLNLIWGDEGSEATNVKPSWQQRGAVDSGTLTFLAVGPAPAQVVGELTRGLVKL